MHLIKVYEKLNLVNFCFFNRAQSRHFLCVRVCVGGGSGEEEEKGKKEGGGGRRNQYIKLKSMYTNRLEQVGKGTTLKNCKIYKNNRFISSRAIDMHRKKANFTITNRWARLQQ